MLRSAVILAAQVFPCALMVLVGWGFNDLPVFFSDPARTGLLVVVAVAAIVAVLCRLDFDPLRKGGGPTGSQSLQLVILLTLSLALLWFLPFADRRRILALNHEYWRHVGLLLTTIGMFVRVVALKTLGKYFSAYVTLQPNHRLVQRGIYASIRHPLYLSLLLAPTGIALVFANWLALPILVLAAAFVFDRIQREEHLLAANFGLEFDGYRRRTRKLIPLLF
jgi:protein-S-isoprenylcysteine O-methyltransferase Ste14